MAALSFARAGTYIPALMSPPFSPCIPTRAPKPPTGEHWVYEIKHDGYRLIVRRVDEHVTLRTRGGYTIKRNATRASCRSPRMV